jgi:hypothetical protein
MVESLKYFFVKFQTHYILLLVPAFFMLLWHIIDNGLPVSDGGGFFFRSVLLYENFFLEKDNFFESAFRYINDVIANRGAKPTLFPALGTPFLILSFGNWNAAFALMGVFYVSVITIFSYLLIVEFTGKKYYSALSAIIIGTLPAVFANAITNLAEIGLIAFLLPAFYFLYKSNYFSVANYSKYFAIFATLAISIRPIQALILLLLPILISLWQGKTKNIFTKEQLTTISYLLVLFLCILLYVPYLNVFQCCPSRDIWDELYYQHIANGTARTNIDSLNYFYQRLTIFFTLLLATFSSFLIYKKQLKILYKELSFKFKNYENYILQTFLLIFALNIIVWALQFHDLFNWAFGAIIGNTLTGWKGGGLVADNSNDAFLTILSGSIQHNAFFAFYFTLISVFLLALLNKKIPTPKIFIYIFASSLILPVLTLFSTQTGYVRFVPTVTVSLVILLILLGGFKRYAKLPIFLVLSFVLFKSFVFFDYSLNFQFVKQDFYSFAQNKYASKFPRGFSQDKADPIKDSDLYTLELLTKYHEKYNFKRAYVDGSSKLTGKYGVDPFKIKSLSLFKNSGFDLGGYISNNPQKYDENSYKMIADQGYDFMFLLNPLLHDDGSQKYKDDLQYRHNCFAVTDPCNISTGSLESFKVLLDFARMINDGSISKTKWELVETIKHYNYDVFIMKLKSE